MAPRTLIFQGLQIAKCFVVHHTGLGTVFEFEKDVVYKEYKETLG